MSSAIPASPVPDSGTDEILAATRKLAAQDAEPAADPEPEEPAEEAAPAEDPAPGEVEGDDETAEEPEPVEAGEYTVVIDGEEHKVSQSELIAGYQRQKDYTRKTAAISEQRAKLETERAGYTRERSTLAEGLKGLVQKAIEQIEGQDMTELESLKDSDPGLYARKILERQGKIALAQQLNDRQQQLEAQVRAESIPREREAFIAKAKAFKPDISPDNFDAYYGEVSKYAVSQGITPAEWNQVTDHRHVTLVAKAMEHDKLATRKAPQVKKQLAALPRVAKPGQPKSAQGAADKERAAMRAKIAKGGTFEDALAYAEKYLPA